MRCVFAVLCLLLAACGSSTPYERGAPARPVPTRSAPAFQPQEDSPHTVGQPGHQRERPAVRRSENRRVLPETPAQREREGVWAADGDERRAADLKASRPLDADRPKGVPQPARDFCREEAAKLATQAGAAGMPVAVRRCLEDRFLRLDCAEGLMKHNETTERKVTNWNHPFFRRFHGRWDREDFDDDVEAATEELDEGPCRDAKNRKAALEMFHGIRAAHGGAIDWPARVPSTSTGRN